MDSTKIIELFIDEEYENAGIEAISLVSKPAHEENWLAFKRQDCSCGTHKMGEEIEEISPYQIVEDNFCDNNPKFLTVGEKYSDLVNDGWDVVKVQKITASEVYKMQEQKFSNPNAESQLDTDEIRVRYKYIGPRDDRNRVFCAQMLAADRVYTIEDIEQLSNPEFGSYNIFLYRGSFNCRHAWVRLVYKKSGRIANDAGRTKGLITEDVVIGADTRNKGTKAVGETGLYAPRNVANPRKAPAIRVREDASPRDGSQFSTDFAEIGPRGGIKKSDKAPKSDTPNPEPKGEGTAKGDASGKRGATVTADQEKTLQGKVKDFNEKDSNTKNGNATLGALKSVFQRGLGAFNTSHSPNVKSAEQWAFARVNAFLYLLKNGRPENPKYTTDYDLLPKDHPKYSMSEDEFAESISDYPEGVKSAAQRALNYAEKNGWGSCGTPVGKTRANQLAKGEPISIETIKRMYSFLARHKGQGADKGKYGEGCGKLMYDAWGGDAGLSWAERKLNQIEKQKMTFAFDEEKKIVIGAAMVPNRMIHRYDDLGNLYYVFFSKESIKKMAQKFLKEKRTDETSIEHDGIKLGKDKVYISESWISEDETYDKSVKYGFSLPVGTWYVSMKVNDDKVWKMIKQKSLNGFSVEGLFAEKSVFSKEDKQINQIKTILKSIKDE
jgi:hypothetical protein